MPRCNPKYYHIFYVDGNAVETWCGEVYYNGRWYKRDCCEECDNYWGTWTDCLNILSGSRYNQRRQAQYHCRRAYDNPFYCDPFFGGRKKRSETFYQTIVTPTVSGIKKIRKPPTL